MSTEYGFNESGYQCCGCGKDMDERVDCDPCLRSEYLASLETEGDLP